MNGAGAAAAAARAGCDCHPDYRRLFVDAPGSCGLTVTRLLRCERCGLVFVDPRPSQEEVERFYARPELWTDSVDAEGRPRSYVKELDAKRPVFADLARRIERRRASGRLLDVGCAAGLLERELDPSRWQVTGVERSDFIAEFGRRELKTHVITGWFEDVAFAPASFDVIVMKYTLEHLDDPFAALDCARGLLKPDGWLVLADVINIDSFCARRFRGGYRLIHPIHYTYFNLQTLSATLQRSGFDVRQVEYPFWRTPYATVENLATLATRVVKRAWLDATGRRDDIVYSVPFRGNYMDVWASPAASHA